MGFGDELIASGQARGLAQQGRRAAFGNGMRIIWSKHAEHIHQNNPNVAPPGSENSSDLVWIKNYSGDRPYNRISSDRRRWIWKKHTIKAPGEVFFTSKELSFADQFSLPKPFIVIEPNVPRHKSVAINKLWPLERYQQVVYVLRKRGFKIVQFVYGARNVSRIAGAYHISSPSFRHALAVMQRSRLFIGSEGGMHHGAAAVGIPAVVLFGGFISPDVTGYDTHKNIFVGGDACGSLTPCPHCRQAMLSITADQVIAEVDSIFKEDVDAEKADEKQQSCEGEGWTDRNSERHVSCSSGENGDGSQAQP